MFRAGIKEGISEGIKRGLWMALEASAICWNGALTDRSSELRSVTSPSYIVISSHLYEQNINSTEAKIKDMT